MRSWTPSLATALLLGALGSGFLFAGDDPKELGQAKVQPPGSKPEAPRPQADPKDPGAGCVSGCSAAKDATPDLSKARFGELLARFAKQPLNSGSEALEHLLFYHPSARGYLRSLGAGPLDKRRAAFLRRELAKKDVWIDLRVVDERGAERIRLRPQRIPLDEKQHLHLKSSQLVAMQPLEVSGTVKRVGLYHLWTRI